MWSSENSTKYHLAIVFDPKMSEKELSKWMHYLAKLLFQL